MSEAWPSSIADVETLEELLSRPTERVIDVLGRLEGDLLILGVGGKMGPTLARMARRARDAAGVRRKIYGVSRFSDPLLPARLAEQGIEPVACDLLAPGAMDSLPDAPNVVMMAARKFGSSGQETLTWGMNVLVPALACERFAASRIVAFSTGNVYAFTPKESGGSRETDPLAPVGEYAMSALARERMYEYFSRERGVKLALLRLNYATETRYGVMVDLAQKVWAEQPIDLAMGYFNAIWQGDANAMALQAFDFVASPPLAVNLAGPLTLSVREVCEEFGQRMRKRVVFTGEEAPTALLSNGSTGHGLFGKPQIAEPQLIAWIADWVARGGATLGKPTHFEVRNGKF